MIPPGAEGNFKSESFLVQNHGLKLHFAMTVLIVILHIEYDSFPVWAAQINSTPILLFQQCMERNRIDPAYKLFVILIEPEETLKRFMANMDKYFRSKTYLLKDDPHLWTKLTKYRLKMVSNEGINTCQLPPYHFALTEHRIKNLSEMVL